MMDACPHADGAEHPDTRQDGNNMADRPTWDDLATRVPPQYRDQVLTGGTLFVQKCFLLGIPVALVAALCFMALYDYGLVAQGLCAAVFLLSFGLVFVAFNLKWETFYLMDVTKQAFKQRKENTVDPDDPEAVFVEVETRDHTASFLGNAYDVGFLKPDGETLLFEGDRHCYRIPFQAIDNIEVEWINKDLPMVVVTVETTDGTWERLFLPSRFGDGRRLTGTTLHRCRTLANLLNDAVRRPV